MANEITEAGYDDLRAHVMKRWDSFSLRYQGVQVLPVRLEDKRISYHIDGENVVFTLPLQLADTDVAALPEPRTFDQVALIAPGGEASAETFEPATIDENEPELVITYRIRLPTEGLPGPPGKDGRGIGVFHQNPGGNAVAGDIWIES